MVETGMREEGVSKKRNRWLGSGFNITHLSSEDVVLTQPKGSKSQYFHFPVPILVFPADNLLTGAMPSNLLSK